MLFLIKSHKNGIIFAIKTWKRSMHQPTSFCFRLRDRYYRNGNIIRNHNGPDFFISQTEGQFIDSYLNTPSLKTKASSLKHDVSGPLVIVLNSVSILFLIWKRWFWRFDTLITAAPGALFWWKMTVEWQNWQMAFMYCACWRQLRCSMVQVTVSLTTVTVLTGIVLKNIDKKKTFLCDMQLIG